MKSTFYIRGQPIGIVAVGLALLASMGGAIFGYDTGQISDILVMEDFIQRFGSLQPDGSYAFGVWREGLIVAMLSIGTAIGALMGASLADKLGRRRAMSVDCIIFSIGVIIQCTAFRAWYQVMIGRIIAGLGVGALSAAVPAYQGECAPREIRGTLVACYQWSITAGILAAYVICLCTRYIGGRNAVGSLASAQWRLPIALGINLALILGLGILAMPESPRWLMMQGRHHEAALSLARIRGLHGETDHPIVQRDYVEIQQGVEAQLARDRERAEKVGGGWFATSMRAWGECFNPKRKILYRTILGVVAQALQQLTGANYFFYYGATIFQSVGLNDSFVTQLILGAVNFVSTAGALFIMEYFGRRKPLIIGALGCSAALFVYAGVGVGTDTSQKSNGDILIVFSVIFIVFYATTWAPGVWILMSETFPSKTRAKQAALSTMSNWIWNFNLGFFTPSIVGNIGFAYGFVFAGCNLFGACFVYLFLYESAGLSLEAVDIMYTSPDVKPWTSGNWAPPGYASREDMRNNKRTDDVAADEVEKGGKGASNGGMGGEQAKLEGGHPNGKANGTTEAMREDVADQHTHDSGATL